MKALFLYGKIYGTSKLNSFHTESYNFTTIFQNNQNAILLN